MCVSENQEFMPCGTVISIQLTFKEIVTIFEVFPDLLHHRRAKREQRKIFIS